LSHIPRRLCGPPCFSLSFTLSTVLPGRPVSRVCSGAEGVESSHTKRAPFTARTTGVSNPVCSPGLRASVSGTVQRPAFATGLPYVLYAFHCYIVNSSLLPSPHARQYRMQFRSYAPKFHTRL